MRKSLSTKLLLLIGVAVLLGTSMILIVLGRNTDVRSRAAYPHPTATPTTSVEAVCEAAWQAGEEASTQCESYYDHREQTCESAFQNDQESQGCDGYVNERKNTCREAALVGTDIPDNCNSYLNRDPITIPERICFSSPDYPGCN